MQTTIRKNNMKRIREEKGITQMKMAAITGCDKTYLSLLETGRIRTKQIDRCILFAKTCDTTVEKLFE